MIKNPPAQGEISHGRARWLLLGLLLVACNQARAGKVDPLQGVIEYDQRAIGFELGGRVLELPVQRGQQVVSGTRLARLDDGLERPTLALRAAELAGAEANARLLRKGTRAEELRAAEAEIAGLQAQEETLAKNLEREKKLQAAGAAPLANIDSMSSDLRSTAERKRALEQRLKAMKIGARSDELAAADARVQAATATLALIEQRLARYTLASPAPGSIIDVHVEIGEIVAPGAPVVTLADLDHPYADVYVPEARMPTVAIGQAVEVRVDGLSKPMPAKVEHIFPGTAFTPRYLFSDSERSNLVVRVRVRIEDPRHQLHAGVPAFATLLGRANEP